MCDQATDVDITYINGSIAIYYFNINQSVNAKYYTCNDTELVFYDLDTGDPDDVFDEI